MCGAQQIGYEPRPSFSIRLIHLDRDVNERIAERYLSVGRTPAQGFYDSPQQTNDVRQTTVFEDQRPPKCVCKSATRSDAFCSNIRDSYTIERILARPIVLAQGVWADSQLQDTTLAQIDIYNAFRTKANFNEKIDYFRYLACNVRFRLLVNAAPSQCGMLLLWHKPYHTEPNQMPHNGIETKTGYDSMAMNLVEGTDVEMGVPYTYERPYIDLHKGGDRLLGEIFVSVYGQLRSGSAHWQLQAYLTDIDLSLPTLTSNKPPPTAIAHVGDSPMFEYEVNDQTGVKEVVGEAVPVAPPPMVEPVETRVLESATLPTEAQEATKEGSAMRPSTVVGAVASAADALSVIPPIAWFTKPVAWVARGASSLLSFFGYSKPTLASNVNFMLSQAGRNMQNFNGGDVSNVMALDAENEVAVQPLYHTPLDEMSFNALVTRPCYNIGFSWNANMAAGFKLWSDPVIPHPRVEALSDRILLTHDFLSYVGMAFRYWRGDIIYTIRFVKTNFHGGRVRVWWQPGDSDFDTDLTNSSESNAYSAIVDLRTQSTCTITIPFAADAPWLRTLHDHFDTSSSTGTLQAYNGYIYMQVVTPLVAPANVSQEIDIMVERSGAPGFCFACPDPPRGLPYIDGVSLREEEEEEWNHIEPSDVDSVSGLDGESVDGDAHVGRDTNIPLEATYITRGSGRRCQPPRVAPGMTTIGEQIVSVRQLLKAYHHCDAFTMSTISSPPNTYIRPFHFYLVSQASMGAPYATPLNPPGTFTKDFIYYFAPLYAFYSGSMRVKFQTSRLSPSAAGGETGQQVASLTYGPPTPRTGSSSALFTQSGFSQHLQDNFQNRIFSYQLPYYRDVPYKSRTRPQYEEDTSTPGLAVHSADIDWHGRAIGDDFSFGFIVGPPRCMIAWSK